MLNTYQQEEITAPLITTVFIFVINSVIICPNLLSKAQLPKRKMNISVTKRSKTSSVFYSKVSEMLTQFTEELKEKTTKQSWIDRPPPTGML